MSFFFAKKIFSENEGKKKERPTELIKKKSVSWIKIEGTRRNKLFFSFLNIDVFIRTEDYFIIFFFVCFCFFKYFVTGSCQTKKEIRALFFVYCSYQQPGPTWRKSGHTNEETGARGRECLFSLLLRRGWWQITNCCKHKKREREITKSFSLSPSF